MINNRIAFLLGLVLVALCLLQVLRTTLYSDDKRNFQRININCITGKANPYAETAYYNKNAISMGRFTPLAYALQEYCFYFLNTVCSYKWYIWCCNLAAIVAFMFMLHSLKTRLNLTACFLGLVAVMQLRVTYHDAYTSINGMYQAISFFSFLATGFFVLWFKRQKTFYFLLAWLFYTLSHLVSEVGLSAFVLLILAAFVLKMPLKTLFKKAWPFFTVTVAYLAYTAWLKTHPTAPSIYPGLVANTNLGDMGFLTVKQVFAALPLSSFYSFFLHANVSAALGHQLKQPLNLALCLGIVLLAGLITWQVAKPAAKGHFNNRVLLFGLALMIFPALFIAPSAKYQDEVTGGMGYLPVYIQNFGTAIVLAGVFTLFNKKGRAGHWMALGWGGVLTIIAVITLLLNTEAIDRCNYNHGIPTIAMFEAEKAGALADVPEGSTVVLTHDYYYHEPKEHQKNYLNLYGKHFKVYEEEFWKPGNTNTGDCYLFDCQPGNPVITKVYKLNCSNGEKLALLRQFKWPCNIELLPE